MEPQDRIEAGFSPEGFWITATGATTPDAAQEVAMDVSVGEMKRICALTDKLDDNSTIKQIADSLLTHSRQRLESLTPILQPLIRPLRHSWRERQTAAWILGHATLTSEQRKYAVDTLLQILERRLEPELVDNLRINVWRTLPLAALAGLGTHREVFFGPPPAVVLMMLIVLYPIVYTAGRALDKARLSRIQAEAATSLGRLAAPESLDALVYALSEGAKQGQQMGRARVREAAAQALIYVLPAVTESHYGLYRSDTITRLCRALSGVDEPLAVAILNAFRHLGNASTLQTVEKLAQGKGRAANEPRVRAAAIESARIIQQRIARENAPQTLLRGASVPETPQGELLRAVTESAESTPFDPMEMLRSSIAPDWKGSDRDINLIIQILNDVRQSGDVRALPYVQQIAHSPQVSWRAREAAQACLPTLQAHSELQQAAPSTPDVLRLQNGNGQ